MPIRRLDWWCGVIVVAASIVLHALIPRYQLFPPASSDWTTDLTALALIRFDRWTGKVERGSFIHAPGGPQWFWLPMIEAR